MLDLFITGIACLVIGMCLGALIITHPVAALRAITPPKDTIDELKAKIAELESKIKT